MVLPGPPKRGRRFEHSFDIQRISTAALVLVAVSAAAVWGINRFLGPTPAPTTQVADATPAEAPPTAEAGAPPAKTAPGAKESPGSASSAPPKTDRASTVAAPPRTAPPTIDRFTPSPSVAAASAAPRANPARPSPPPAGVRGATERVDVSASAPDVAIYSSRDADVTPPVILWPQQLGRIPTLGEDQAMIEVVVNPDGSVAQVKAQGSPRTLDESMVMTMSLSAAKSWIFTPAYKDGRPVRYRQLVPVSVR